MLLLRAVVAPAGSHTHSRSWQICSWIALASCACNETSCRYRIKSLPPSQDCHPASNGSRWQTAAARLFYMQMSTLQPCNHLLLF